MPAGAGRSPRRCRSWRGRRADATARTREDASALDEPGDDDDRHAGEDRGDAKMQHMRDALRADTDRSTGELLVRVLDTGLDDDGV